MDNRSDIQQIDRYIKGELSAEEQAAFLASCKQDPELAQQLELQLKAKAAVYLHARDQHRQALKKWFQDENEMPQGRVRQITPAAWLMAVAAAVVLLLAVGWWFSTPASGSIDNQALFAITYERPRVPEELKLDENPLPLQELRAQARNHYHEGDYAAAADLFTQLTAQEEGLRKSQAHLYLGISLLEQGQAEVAREAFAQATELPEQAEWYTALSYLKENRLADCREALKKITSYQQHYYKEKAMELQKELGE